MAISAVKVIVNGTTHNLTYNPDTGAYEGDITAPQTSSFNQAGGYYNVEVVAMDDSGNSTTADSSDASFGDSLKLYVKETAEPTISIISPTNNAVLTNNLPTFSWTVTDDDSGIDTNSINMLVDDTEVDGTINVTDNGGTYTCSYIPTSALIDGDHEIVYVVSDNDGNESRETINIKVDTVAPALNITAPEDNAKVNTSPVTVSGYTNDTTSSPVTVTVNGQNVSVDGSGFFTINVDLQQGDNNIEIIATDAAGKSTSVTRNVSLNSNPPVIESISITPNPVDVGASFRISVVVSDS